MPVDGCNAAGWRGSDPGASACFRHFAACTAGTEAGFIPGWRWNFLLDLWGDIDCEAPARLFDPGRVALTALVGLPAKGAAAGIEGLGHDWLLDWTSPIAMRPLRRGCIAGQTITSRAVQAWHRCRDSAGRFLHRRGLQPAPCLRKCRTSSCAPPGWPRTASGDLPACSGPGRRS